MSCLGAVASSLSDLNRDPGARERALSGAPLGATATRDFARSDGSDTPQ